MFDTFIEKVKSFFKNSWTIFVARFTAVAGLITAALGAMDWSPLLGLNIQTGFSKAQAIYLGVITFVQGLMVEIARRRTLP